MVHTTKFQLLQNFLFQRKMHGLGLKIHEFAKLVLKFKNTKKALNDVQQNTNHPVQCAQYLTPYKHVTAIAISEASTVSSRVVKYNSLVT